ncbi:hypothetical protein ACJX0J_015664, partial [Zea mays]
MELDLRQGDPLSLILFNIENQFQGIVPHLVPGGFYFAMGWLKNMNCNIHIYLYMKGQIFIFSSLPIIMIKMKYRVARWNVINFLDGVTSNPIYPEDDGSIQHLFFKCPLTLIILSGLGQVILYFGLFRILKMSVASVIHSHIIWFHQSIIDITFQKPKLLIY